MYIIRDIHHYLLTGLSDVDVERLKDAAASDAGNHGVQSGGTRMVNPFLKDDDDLRGFELIEQLRAYDELVVKMHALPFDLFAKAERWVKNYQQITGNQKVPPTVLRTIVEHFEAERDGRI